MTSPVTRPSAFGGNDRLPMNMRAGADITTPERVFESAEISHAEGSYRPENRSGGHISLFMGARHLTSISRWIAQAPSLGRIFGLY